MQILRNSNEGRCGGTPLDKTRERVYVFYGYLSVATLT